MPTQGLNLRVARSSVTELSGVKVSRSEFSSQATGFSIGTISMKFLQLIDLTHDHLTEGTGSRSEFRIRSYSGSKSAFFAFFRIFAIFRGTYLGFPEYDFRFFCTNRFVHSSTTIAMWNTFPCHQVLRSYGRSKVTPTGLDLDFFRRVTTAPPI